MHNNTLLCSWCLYVVQTISTPNSRYILPTPPLILFTRAAAKVNKINYSVNFSILPCICSFLLLLWLKNFILLLSLWCTPEVTYLQVAYSFFFLGEWWGGCQWSYNLHKRFLEGVGRNSSWGWEIPLPPLLPSFATLTCTVLYRLSSLVVKLVKPTCILSLIVEMMVSIIAPPGRNLVYVVRHANSMLLWL